MINFIRRTRQSLLSEGKTGKYLKYALGEIILVVLGILIALSKNNWNEEKKLKQKATTYLKNVSDFIYNTAANTFELQKRLQIKDDNYYHSSVKLIPNHELYNIILSFGDKVEILSPEHIRDGIAKKIKEMNKLYSKELSIILSLASNCYMLKRW